MRLTQQQKGNVFHTGEKRKEGNEKGGERERGKEGGGTFPLFLSFLAYDVIGGERGVVGPPPLHTFVPTTLDQLAGCSPSLLSFLGSNMELQFERGSFFGLGKNAAEASVGDCLNHAVFLSSFCTKLLHVAPTYIYLVKHANYVLGYL